MGDYCFGQGPGHLPEKADRIAQRHGAVLVNHIGQRAEARHWFSGPCRGEPRNSEMAKAVIADLRAAGIGGR